MKIVKVNISWKVTELTEDELDRYLFNNPEYKETYFIISERYEDNKNSN